MTEQIFTIGHSSRTLTELLTLLAGSRIELVIDVRKLPGSTRYPQFDEDALSASLGETGIELRRFEGLTGRRPVNRDVPFGVNAWWDNRSFHNYADHALGNDFRNSLVELRACAQVSRTAIMCSEAVWWRCHRRIITEPRPQLDQIRRIVPACDQFRRRDSKGRVNHYEHLSAV
jgi:uncharacterized protein (DUF488 family)